MNIALISPVLGAFLFVLLTGGPTDAKYALLYYGCYRDYPTPGKYDLERYQFRLHMQDILTPERCFDYCRTRSPSFEVAGVENGNACFCGHTFGKYGQIDEKFCNKPCAGDRNKMCGGPGALGIYSIEANFKTDPPRTAGYLGCYTDSRVTRDLDVSSRIFDTTGNSPEKCIDRCFTKAYKYAGVQNGKECNCGNSYGIHGPAIRWECSVKCTGDKSRKCGGDLRNSIYETGRWYSSWPNENVD